MGFRSRIYELLEDDETSSPVQRRVRLGLVAAIVASVIFACVDTVDSVHQAWGGWLHGAEIVFVALFTIEYLLRLWVVVDDRVERYRRPVSGRLRYALTPLAIVDLLAIAPFYLSLAMPLDPVMLRSLRLLRVLKIARFSPALSTIEVVIINERRALLSSLLVFVVALLLSSALMFAAERHAQNDAFASIPAAMWWSIATLTTVGYGDVVPVTPFGRIVAGFTALLGIGMLALPTAILGAGFVQELRKRDFGLAAAMIVRVPVFRHLGAAQLAELAALLHPRALPPRYTLMRIGEHPDAMYFIDEGQVIIRTAQRRLVLGPGEYFGELALLEGAPRRATITTLTGCRLLELRANDFLRLVTGDASLRQTLLDEAKRRYGFEEYRRHDVEVADLSE